MASIFNRLFASPPKASANSESDEKDETMAEPATQLEEMTAPPAERQQDSPNGDQLQEEEEQHEEEESAVQFQTQMMPEEGGPVGKEEAEEEDAEDEAGTTEDATTQARAEETPQDEETEGPQTQMESFLENSSPPPTQEVSPKAPEKEQKLPPQQEPILPQNGSSKKANVHFPPMPPRTARKENFQRYRSLSKVFTKLPDQIPNVPTMMIDMLEYICQIILMETDLDKLRDLQIRLEQLLPHCVPRIANGRVHCRLQLVALALDVAHSTEWEPKDWKSAITQFEYVRSRLWMEDANDPPEKVRANHVRKNTKISQHPSMTNEYKDAMNQLQFQEAIAIFREDLEVDNTIRNVERAIDKYRRNLQLIFGSPVPHHLEAFVKADVYSPKRAAHPSSNAERLKHHCRQLHDHNVLHGILLRWAEVILDPPALIKLGYGGVTGVYMPHHNDDDDDDDVSSIGEEDNEALQQTKDTSLMSEEDRDAAEQLARVSRRASEPTKPSAPPAERTQESARPRNELRSEETTQAPTNMFQRRKDPPTERHAPKRRRELETSTTVWSSDDDEDEPMNDQQRRGPKKSLFRLYESIVKKRRMETYDSTKENADPDLPHPGDSRAPEEEKDDGDESSSSEDLRDRGVKYTKKSTRQASVMNAGINDDNDDDGQQENDQEQSSVSDDDTTKAVCPGKLPTRPPNSASKPEDSDDDDDEEDDETADGDESSNRQAAISAPGRMTRDEQPAKAKAHDRLSLTSPTLPANQPRSRKRKFFTEEEDTAIFEGLAKYGPKWSIIQKEDPRLKDRNDTDVRCRYRNIMLKQNRA